LGAGVGAEEEIPGKAQIGSPVEGEAWPRGVRDNSRGVQGSGHSCVRGRNKLVGGRGDLEDQKDSMRCLKAKPLDQTRRDFVVQDARALG